MTSVESLQIQQNITILYWSQRHFGIKGQDLICKETRMLIWFLMCTTIQSFMVKEPKFESCVDFLGATIGYYFKRQW